LVVATYAEEVQRIAAAAAIAKQAEVAIVCVSDNYFTTREARGGNTDSRAITHHQLDFIRKF